VLDRKTVACFLELYEMRLDPRKTAKSLVNFLSFGHSARSASKNPLRIKDDDLINLSP
jgi:hypothetical protein